MVRFANPHLKLKRKRLCTSHWINRVRLLSDLPKLLTDQQHVVFRDWTERYGDRFRINIAGQSYIFLSDPKAIKSCFEFGEDKLDAGLARQHFVGFMPTESLLLASGPKRQVLRRVIGKAMAKASESFSVFAAVDEFLSSFQTHFADNFEDRVNDFFLQIISLFLVGSVDSQFMATMAKTLKSIDQIPTATLIFSRLRRIPPFAKGYAEVAKTIVELRENLSRLLRDGVPETSFLANFQRQALANGISLSEVMDNMAMFCFVMPRSLKSMFQNVAHALATETAWQTGLRKAIATDAGSQKMVRATVKETMRLAPLIPIIVRKALCDLEVDGFSVAKEDLIVVTPYLTHFRASSFPHPHQFDPTRFSGHRSYANEYIPYGGGKNHCVGSGWAVEVICKLFRRLLTVVEFSSSRGHPEFSEFSMRTLFLRRRTSQFMVRFIQNV